MNVMEKAFQLTNSERITNLDEFWKDFKYAFETDILSICLRGLLAI